ncbi:MAG: hypothetical protein P4L98_05640 [Ancalomicrobiaceae bacterium]|nr:hypothetical protein [Ancalomicrobiaceae bacterium]
MTMLSETERESINQVIERAYSRGQALAFSQARERASETAASLHTKIAAFEAGFNEGAALNAAQAARADALAANITGFVQAAITGERKRWQATFSSPEAAGRESFVAKPLATSDMQPDSILELAVDVPARSNDHGFAAAMAQHRHGLPAGLIEEAPETDPRAARLKELRANRPEGAKFPSPTVA